MQLVLGCSLACITATIGCYRPQQVASPVPDQQAIVLHSILVLMSNKKHPVMLRPSTTFPGKTVRWDHLPYQPDQSKAETTIQLASCLPERNARL
jgi:hypothetical protein